jgi:plastocyanin
MTKSVINLGTAPNDRTGDTLRDAGTKVNSNFSELYTALGNGTTLGIAVTGATTGQVLKHNGTTFVPASDLNTDAVTSVNTFTGAVVLATDDIAEDGSPVNLWFTNARARSAVSATSGVAYNSSTGVITLSATSDNLTEGTTNLFYTSSRFNTSFGAKTTNDLAEGNVNKYFTNTLARGAISVSGGLAYDSGTGVISFTDGGGTVTAVSVTSANGFTGTVATSTSTPAITITTSITGVLKGNGTAISAATAGTDYQAPITLTTTGTSGAATFTSNTLNIPQYSAVTTFSALTDATSATLTVDKIYLPAITSLAVTNNGSAAYRFDQYGATDNPTIYAISGTTIAFNLGTGGLSSHPFKIRTSGGTNYNTGLIHVTSAGVVTTESSAQEKTSGTLYWKIPVGTTGNYQYICSNHGAMVGVITIKDISAI